MNYIIDGHNLIGKMDGIRLSDPDDEAKLMLRLLNWAAVGKNRRVIVVFDRGMPGEQWRTVRSERVKPVFVPAGRTADDWIISFMKNIKDRQSFKLVTSDRAIQKQAENRRIPFMLSETFAAEMAAERNQFSDIAQEQSDTEVAEARPLLKEEQVDAWLQYFGGEREIQVKPYQPRTVAPPKPPDPEPMPAYADTATPSAPGLLPQDEVAEWLELFGGEKEIVSVHENTIRAKRQPGKDTEEKKVLREIQTDDDDAPLSPEDVELWLSLFGE